MIVHLNKAFQTRMNAFYKSWRFLDWWLSHTGHYLKSDVIKFYWCHLDKFINFHRYNLQPFLLSNQIPSPMPKDITLQLFPSQYRSHNLAVLLYLQPFGRLFTPLDGSLQPAHLRFSFWQRLPPRSNSDIQMWRVVVEWWRILTGARHRNISRGISRPNVQRLDIVHTVDIVRRSVARRQLAADWSVRLWSC